MQKQMKKLFAFLLVSASLLSMFTGCSSGTGAVPVDRATIGAINGSIGEMYIEKTYPKAKLNGYDAISDAITELQEGKLDYVVTAYTTALYFVRYNDGLRILPDRLTDEGAAIAVSKNDTGLRDRISEVLDRFSNDGTLSEIISNWIKEDGSEYTETAIPVKKDGEVLKAGIAANREPMCFIKDDNYVGLDCELIERIAYELGMRVEYTDMKFTALIEELENGRVDVVISNLFPSDERKERVDFTAEYFKNPQILLKRET